MISTVSSFPKPDAHLIGKEANPTELAKLLQLILGAAVNCDNKELYIANIMKLDTDTQIAVKNAIESLFMSIGESTSSPGRTRSGTTDSMMSLPFPDAIGLATDGLLAGSGSPDAALVHQLKLDVRRLTDDLSAAIESKERAIQELFDLKRELKSVKEENSQLNSENELLISKMNKKSSQTSSALSPHDTSTSSISESTDASLKEAFVVKLQNKVESLKEDLFKMENSKEEVRIKNELLEKELMELKFKNEELQRKANEARNLKDELDIHKQLSEKAEKYEATIEVYKKKLEEAAEFKRKIKLTTGDKNVTESKLKISLEEEMRKSSTLKATNDNLKKQIQELTSNLATITHKAESSDFELKMLKQKVTSLYEEKEELSKQLAETKKRLGRNELLIEDEVDNENGNPNALSFELKSNESESKIAALESENCHLKSQLEALTKKLSHFLPELDANSGNGSFRPNNQHQQQEQPDVHRRGDRHALTSDPADVHKLIESLRNEVYDWQQKVSQLEGVLAKKEEEMNEMETRYRKCVTKAKQVAKVLEPISLTSTNSSFSSMANLEQLTLDLAAKDKTIQELEVESEKLKQFKEVEERLMTVAFHSLVRFLLLFFILPCLQLALVLMHKFFSLLLSRTLSLSNPLSLPILSSSNAFDPCKRSPIRNHLPPKLESSSPCLSGL